MFKLKNMLVCSLITGAALCMCSCGSSNSEETTSAASTDAEKETSSSAEVSSEETTESEDGKVHYTVKVVNEEGEPVAGAMVQLCDESCFPGKTDDEGIAEFSLTESDYKVSFLMLPEGYTYIGEEAAFYFEEGSEEITIILKSQAGAGSTDEGSQDSEEDSQEDSIDETTEETEDSSETTTNVADSSSEESASEHEATAPVETEYEATTPFETEPTTETEKETTTPENQNPTTTVPETTPETTTAKPDDGGEAGTSYLEIPDENFSVTTVEIAAGKSVYYDIYRAAGTILEISDPSAYVIYEGTKYTPNNGILRLQVAQGSASDYVSFEIGNSGASKKSFRLQFAFPIGYYTNPEVLTSISGSHSAYSAEGNELGYSYSYVAEKTGTITFYVSSVSSSSKSATAGITVNNNTSYANRTTNADGTDDGNGHVVIEMNVTKGDELRIDVSVNPTATWKYPEATITWVAEYK